MKSLNHTMRGVLEYGTFGTLHKDRKICRDKRGGKRFEGVQNYVDPERTHLNYTIVNSFYGVTLFEGVQPEHRADFRESIDKALKARVEGYQRDTGCQVRKNTVVLSSWVVQCPEVLRGDVDNEKKFLQRLTRL